MQRNLLLGFVMAVFLLVLLQGSCKKTGDVHQEEPPPPVNSDIDYWLTTADRNNLLTKQVAPLKFLAASPSGPVINVDSSQAYQSVDGFGYTLTQGSAYLVNRLGAGVRTALLEELFGNNEQSIGVSFLRIGIGATDLSTHVYSYNDMPAGQTDSSLLNFSLGEDLADLVPLLQQIIEIRPGIKILATPWSPPVWMKDNGSSVGGSLQPRYYDSYANYFVKYIQAIQAKGIPIFAITPQNEPLHPGNNPSMYMTAAQQSLFIKGHLGPAFEAANISTRIIIYDHNCDNTSYPLEILNDPAANPFVFGSAFHLYAGNITALSAVQQAFPSKHIYFTEQYTPANGSFAGDLKWHLKNVIIGSMRNYSRTALEWNLANDGSYGPHTPGGCTTCLGALTIAGGNITRNVGYYIIAQISKFAGPGSVRIASDIYGPLQTVAFARPDGKKVLLVFNEGNDPLAFNIRYNYKFAATSLPGGAVATYVW